MGAWATSGAFRAPRRWGLSPQPAGVPGRRGLCGILLFSCLLLSALMLIPSSATARRTGSAVGRTGANLVEVRFVSRAALRRALREHPARLVRVVAALHVAELRPTGDVLAFERAIRAAAGISSVREVVRRAAAESSVYATSGDSTSAAGAVEWQFSAIGVDRVPAAVISAARNITIAVVDTGADTTAPDLAGRIAGAYDVRTGAHTAVDRNGHGTFVASLAAGSAAPVPGVTGSNGGARLLIVKVADASSFTDIDVAGGILYAVGHGARIINLSVAGRTPSPVEEAAIDYAARRGVLLVAAAGNDALSGDPPEYPAAFLQPVGSAGVGGLGLVVGASDPLGNRAPFSEFGSFVSVAAPGVSVVGAVTPGSSEVMFPRSPPGNAFAAGLHGSASGTSFAAPQVAGAAALVWAANPRLSAGQVAEVLKATASGHGSWTPGTGFGVIDVAAAVDLAIDTVTH